MISLFSRISKSDKKITQPNNWVSFVVYEQLEKLYQDGKFHVLLYKIEKIQAKEIQLTKEEERKIDWLYQKTYMKKKLRSEEIQKKRKYLMPKKKQKKKISITNRIQKIDWNPKIKLTTEPFKKLSLKERIQNINWNPEIRLPSFSKQKTKQALQEETQETIEKEIDTQTTTDSIKTLETTKEKKKEETTTETEAPSIKSLGSLKLKKPSPISKKEIKQEEKESLTTENTPPTLRFKKKGISIDTQIQTPQDVGIETTIDYSKIQEKLKKTKIVDKDTDDTEKETKNNVQTEDLDLGKINQLLEDHESKPDISQLKTELKQIKEEFQTAKQYIGGKSIHSLNKSTEEKELELQEDQKNKLKEQFQKLRSNETENMNLGLDAWEKKKKSQKAEVQEETKKESKKISLTAQTTTSTDKKVSEEVSEEKQETITESHSISEEDHERIEKKKKREKKAASFNWKKIHAKLEPFHKHDDLLHFIEKLSVLLSANIPLYQSLQILERQGKKAGVRYVIKSLITGLDNGKQLSQTMNDQFPSLFNKSTVHIFQAGERSGNMSNILEEYGSNLRESHDIMKKIKGAMIYPSFILFATTSLVTGLMVFIVPKFVEIYDQMDVELPFFTQLIINTSDFFLHKWYIILIAIFGTILTVKLLVLIKQVEEFKDQLLLKIPVFGYIIRQKNIILFANNFYVLLNSGILILEALRIIQKVVTNKKYQKEIDKIINNIGQGGSISKALGIKDFHKWHIEHNPYFELETIQAISIGEQTGKLKEMLFTVNEMEKKNLRLYMAGISSVIEPILIMIVGILVGVVLLGVMMPMFNVGGMIADM